MYTLTYSFFQVLTLFVTSFIGSVVIFYYLYRFFLFIINKINF